MKAQRAVLGEAILNPGCREVVRTHQAHLGKPNLEV